MHISRTPPCDATPRRDRAAAPHASRADLPVRMNVTLLRSSLLPSPATAPWSVSLVYPLALTRVISSLRTIVCSCVSTLSVSRMTLLPRVPLWCSILASFSRSLRAGLGQDLRRNPRKPANYTRYFPGIPGVCQAAQNTRYFADFADFDPQTASDSAQSPEKWMVSPWSFPRKLEGAVGKLAGNTERKPGRVREETLEHLRTG